MKKPPPTLLILPSASQIQYCTENRSSPLSLKRFENLSLWPHGRWHVEHTLPSQGLKISFPYVCRADIKVPPDSCSHPSLCLPRRFHITHFICSHFSNPFLTFISNWIEQTSKDARPSPPFCPLDENLQGGIEGL